MSKKMCLPFEAKALIQQVQTAWEPLKEPEAIQTEEELTPYHAESGKRDLANNPEQYIKNVSRILDFFIYQAPKIMEDLIGTYDEEDVLSALKGIAAHCNKKLNPAAYYLDDQHCAPFIPEASGAEKLYKKMQLLEWFSTKLANLHNEHPTIASPESTALLTHFVNGVANSEALKQISWYKKPVVHSILASIPARMRLPETTRRLDEYDQKHNLTRLSVTEFEKTLPTMNESVIDDEKPEAVVEAGAGIPNHQPERNIPLNNPLSIPNANDVITNIAKKACEDYQKKPHNPLHLASLNEIHKWCEMHACRDDHSAATLYLIEKKYQEMDNQRNFFTRFLRKIGLWPENSAQKLLITIKKALPTLLLNENQKKEAYEKFITSINTINTMNTTQQISPLIQPNLQEEKQDDNNSVPPPPETKPETKRDQRLSTNASLNALLQQKENLLENLLKERSTLEEKLQTEINNAHTATTKKLAYEKEATLAIKLRFSLFPNERTRKLVKHEQCLVQSKKNADELHEQLAKKLDEIKQVEKQMRPTP